jgi:lipoate-protein ligase A
VWTYRTSAVVLGCSQRALHDGVQQRIGGRATLLQRESGGGAVLTGPWLVSASVVLPPDHDWVRGGLVESYRRIAELHVAALQAMGVPARALPPHEVARANEAGAVPRWACFGSLSPWELVNAEGRKLVGLAQRRRRNAVLLVAGTLIGRADWPLLCHAMGHPEDEAVLRQRTVCAEALAGRRIEPEQFASVLTQGLERALSVGGEGSF